MFLCLRDPIAIYKIIIFSCKINAENQLKKKLSLEIFKKTVFPSLKFTFFVFYFFFSFQFIFKQKRLYLKYDDINIGRFITAEVYKNFSTYNSKLLFFFSFFKNLIIAGKLLNSAEKYLKNKNIDAIYIDHCGYINGVLYSYFSKKKIIIYSNNFPRTIYKIDFKKENNYYTQYENSLITSKKAKLTKLKLKKCKNLLKNIFSVPNKLQHMAKIKYNTISKTNYKSFDYVIYAHSFTDGQLWYGLDQFENTLDWIKFTLNFFKNSKKKVLIKGHPNFYEKSIGLLSEWDKKIYLKLKKEYSVYKNFYFIDEPIFNYDLIKKLNKKCILISHHGTVILEGANYGFKTICSNANFFNSYFKISNCWSNIKDYRKLLAKDYKKLHLTNKSDLYSLIYNTFIDDFSYNGKKFWQYIIAKQLNMSLKDYKKIIETFYGVNNHSKSKKYFGILLGKKFKKTVNILQKNIQELEYKK